MYEKLTPLRILSLAHLAKMRGEGWKMTSEEVAALVIQRWKLEHNIDAIMMACLMMRAPLSRVDILAIIRRYVDLRSENVGIR